MRKYDNTQCQKCGEHIGWLGRFNEWFYGLFGINNIIHKCNSKLTTSTDTNTAPDIDKVSTFNVATYSLLDKDVKYCHWSEGLNMVIEKDGVTIKLNSEEIQQIVKSLPKTIGKSY